MLYLFTFLTFLLSFLRFNVVYGHSDELISALIKSANEQGLVEAAVINSKTIPKPAITTNLRALQTKDKPKPDPKPKPAPPQYMVFTNHIDDYSCGDASRIESHGYLIGNCFTGTGSLAGKYWSFTTTFDTDNIYLNYAFYLDSACATPIFSSVETVKNGCAQRGVGGGHLRSKSFRISPTIPDYKNGALFNGFETKDACTRGGGPDIHIWSYLKNNACDPQISSPVYGPHVTDETRTCKNNKIVATLYDSNDLTCSGAVTTVTNIAGPSWNCPDSTISGEEESFVNPRCV